MAIADGRRFNMAFNSALYSKLGYDPLRDFIPVAVIYRFGYVMVGRKDMPQPEAAGQRRGREGRSRHHHRGNCGRRHRSAVGGGRLHEGSGREALEVPYKGRLGVYRSARRAHRSVL